MLSTEQHKPEHTAGVASQAGNNQGTYSERTTKTNFSSNRTDTTFYLVKDKNKMFSEEE